MVSLFIPAALPAASTTSAPAPAATSSGGINTTRPSSSQQAPASASTASPAPQPAPTVTASAGKKRWMMPAARRTSRPSPGRGLHRPGRQRPPTCGEALQAAGGLQEVQHLRPVRPGHRRTVRASAPAHPSGGSTLRPRQARPCTRHRRPLRRVRLLHRRLPHRGDGSPVRAP